MTARLFTLDPVEGYRPKTFAGHRDVVLAAIISSDEKIVRQCETNKEAILIFIQIYTVSRDGAVLVWRTKLGDDGALLDSEMIEADPKNQLIHTRWGVSERHYFNIPNTKVACVSFHHPSNLLVVGFSSGVFGLWELPGFSNVHTLSISQERITSVAINSTGEWLAFGAQKLGQLLVWEWQSESYILKQQGHYFDINTLSYSTDGQNIATGGDDGKIKVWNANSGFCFVTFSDHSASVSGVEFAKQGQVLFSSSLDGTVRAFDLVRYRNFRTFTSPSPVQFSCLAVDTSGEVVAAGSTDTFEVFFWSVQTGKLLDILTGHEGPVSSVMFSPVGNELASGSWDKTVRIWNAFGRSRAVEPFQMNADVLAIAFRPDGIEIAVSTLDGQISFFDIALGRQSGIIDGRRDIAGGRRAADRVAAANNSAGKSFNSLAYSADGTCILAGGNSKYIALYDIREGAMLKKFQISENLSLDGTEEFLDSRLLTEAGNPDMINDHDDDSDLEDRLDKTLPGTLNGDLSKRRWKLEARTKCVRFSPTGRSWAAASTEGLLLYSNDDPVTFDPFDLDIDLTPQSILSILSNHEYLKSLVMAFRLNEQALIQKVFEAIPFTEVALISRELPRMYLQRILKFIGEHMEKTPHVEYDLLWINSLLAAHGRYLKDHSTEFASVFRGLHKGLTEFQTSTTALYVASNNRLAEFTKPLVDVTITVVLSRI